MRRIGLLGGMSWESSAEYYRLANELVRDRLGGLHSADCLLAPVDFAPVAELLLLCTADDRATVHRIIYDELCVGVVRPESLQDYRRVIGRLVDRGAEGVVLGCTEIELLVGAGDGWRSGRTVDAHGLRRTPARRAISVARAR